MANDKKKPTRTEYVIVPRTPLGITTAWYYGVTWNNTGKAEVFGDNGSKGIYDVPVVGIELIETTSPEKDKDQVSYQFIPVLPDGKIDVEHYNDNDSYVPKIDAGVELTYLGEESQGTPLEATHILDQICFQRTAQKLMGDGRTRRIYRICLQEMELRRRDIPVEFHSSRSIVVNHNGASAPDPGNYQPLPGPAHPPGAALPPCISDYPPMPHQQLLPQWHVQPQPPPVVQVAKVQPPQEVQVVKVQPQPEVQVAKQEPEQAPVYHESVAQKKWPTPVQPMSPNPTAYGWDERLVKKVATQATAPKIDPDSVARIAPPIVIGGVRGPSMHERVRRLKKTGGKIFRKKFLMRGQAEIYERFMVNEVRDSDDMLFMMLRVDAMRDRILRFAGFVDAYIRKLDYIAPLATDSMSNYLTMCEIASGGSPSKVVSELLNVFDRIYTIVVLEAVKVKRGLPWLCCSVMHGMLMDHARRVLGECVSPTQEITPKMLNQFRANIKRVSSEIGDLSGAINEALPVKV